MSDSQAKELLLTCIQGSDGIGQRAIVIVHGRSTNLGVCGAAVPGCEIGGNFHEIVQWIGSLSDAEAEGGLIVDEFN